MSSGVACTCARLSGDPGSYPCPVHPEMGAATVAGPVVLPPGPPDPPSRHLWGSTGTGPQGNEPQGDPTAIPGHVVNAVWSLNDRQQLKLFRELLRHLSRGLSREQILEVMEDALFRSRTDSEVRP